MRQQLMLIVLDMRICIGSIGWKGLDDSGTPQAFMQKDKA